MKDKLEVTLEDVKVFSLQLEKLDMDIVKAIKSGAMILKKRDIRYLVDLYYQVQESRKSAKNIERASEKDNEPCVFITHLARQQYTLERQVKSALTAWALIQPGCEWALSVFAIGPIISAGLAAHITIEAKTTSIGKLWRYGGVDPTSEWKKGHLRPWNARLKVLIWKIGDSFRKFHNFDECYYGKVYEERKEYEVARNERGEMKETAEEALKTGRWKKSTVAYACYKEGILPPGQIDARAARYAAKLFLAHWWDMEYQRIYKCKPPAPYPIAILGHQDYIPPPIAEAG